MTKKMLKGDWKSVQKKGIQVTSAHHQQHLRIPNNLSSLWYSKKKNKNIQHLFEKTKGSQKKYKPQLKIVKANQKSRITSLQNKPIHNFNYNALKLNSIQYMQKAIHPPPSNTTHTTNLSQTFFNQPTYCQRQKSIRAPSAHQHTLQTAFPNKINQNNNPQRSSYNSTIINPYYTSGQYKDNKLFTSQTKFNNYLQENIVCKQTPHKIYKPDYKQNLFDRNQFAMNNHFVNTYPCFTQPKVYQKNQFKSNHKHQLTKNVKITPACFSNITYDKPTPHHQQQYNNRVLSLKNMQLAQPTYIKQNQKMPVNRGDDLLNQVDKLLLNQKINRQKKTESQTYSSPITRQQINCSSQKIFSSNCQMKQSMFSPKINECKDIGIQSPIFYPSQQVKQLLNQNDLKYTKYFQQQLNNGYKDIRTSTYKPSLYINVNPYINNDGYDTANYVISQKSKQQSCLENKNIYNTTDKQIQYDSNQVETGQTFNRTTGVNTKVPFLTSNHIDILTYNPMKPKNKILTQTKQFQNSNQSIPFNINESSIHEKKDQQFDKDKYYIVVSGEQLRSLISNRKNPKKRCKILKQNISKIRNLKYI